MKIYETCSIIISRGDVMTGTGIVLLIVGILTLAFGLTGLSSKTRRGQRLVNILGEGGARALNILLGIAFIVAAFFI